MATIIKPTLKVITGSSKIGKTYYASNFKNILFLDYYNDNSISGNKIVISEANLIGTLEFIKIQLCLSEAKNTFKTIVIDGFERFYKDLVQECEDCLGLDYWLDKNQKESQSIKIAEQKVIEWCSTLLMAGYDIVLIYPDGSIISNNSEYIFSFNRIIDFFVDRRWCNYESIHIFMGENGKRFVRINGELEELK